MDQVPCSNSFTASSPGLQKQMPRHRPLRGLGLHKIQQQQQGRLPMMSLHSAVFWMQGSASHQCIQGRTHQLNTGKRGLLIQVQISGKEKHQVPSSATSCKQDLGQCRTKRTLSMPATIWAPPLTNSQAITAVPQQQQEQHLPLRTSASCRQELPGPQTLPGSRKQEMVYSHDCSVAATIPSTSGRATLVVPQNQQLSRRTPASSHQELHGPQTLPGRHLRRSRLIKVPWMGQVQAACLLQELQAMDTCKQQLSRMLVPFPVLVCPLHLGHQCPRHCQPLHCQVTQQTKRSLCSSLAPFLS